jgi:hypothetical protein
LDIGDGMAKKATIVISLVDESCENTIEQIEKEIFQELLRNSTRIPWCKKIEKVKVV